MDWHLALLLTREPWKRMGVSGGKVSRVLTEEAGGVVLNSRRRTRREGKHRRLKERLVKNE